MQTRPRRKGWKRGNVPRIAAIVVTALLRCSPTAAQSPDPAAEPEDGATTVAKDIKAYVTAPLHAHRKQWVRFGATLGAIAVAYQYDDQVREHFDTTLSAPGETPDTNEAGDALPAALVVGATWVTAALLDEDGGRREAGSMLEAAAFSTVAGYILKQVAGRERPYATADSSAWGNGGDSFPSLHTTAAFAIGTVLAESGGDRYRLLRRVLGYGIAAGTAYARMDHDAHWLSDTVAGAGLGIATARFVMKRRDGTERRGQVGLVPWNEGVALTYTVELRR
jgi:hypothetical protein